MPNKTVQTSAQAALINFDLLPDDALARVPTVGALFACSVPTIWRWTKTGKLPAPLRVGGVTGWRVGDLRKILSGSR